MVWLNVQYIEIPPGAVQVSCGKVRVQETVPNVTVEFEMSDELWIIM